MTGRLENKVCLVTGAASGIGAASCQRMAEEGALVIVSDINHDAGERIAKDIGHQAVYLPLDVSVEREWQEAIQKIKRDFGRLDVLVNNAGIIGLGNGFGPQDPEHVSLDDWNQVQKVNTVGTFLGCKYGIQLMKKNKSGSIINMSSRSGMVGVPTLAPYAASKAAGRNHTKTVALYCAQKGYNIRCNSIHPAAVLTPLWDKMLGKDRVKSIEEIASGIPLGAMGEPDDVAYAVVYLASDESKFITGIELTIDGGILAGSTACPSDEEE